MAPIMAKAPRPRKTQLASLLSVPKAKKTNAVPKRIERPMKSRIIFFICCMVIVPACRPYASRPCWSASVPFNASPNSLQRLLRIWRLRVVRIAKPNTVQLHQPARPVPTMIPDTESGKVRRRKDFIYGFIISLYSVSETVSVLYSYLNPKTK